MSWLSKKLRHVTKKIRSADPLYKVAENSHSKIAEFYRHPTRALKRSLGISTPSANTAQNVPVVTRTQLGNTGFHRYT